MNNGPLSVSKPGVSLIGASSRDVTFSTKFPFHKLDSTNPVSFQIVTLFFNTEPPTPSVGNTTKTLIYRFVHGYTYEPSSWFLVSENNFSTVLGPEGVWIYGSASGVNLATAQLYIEVDSTYVSFYVSKTVISIGGLPNIIGRSFSIRSYIFVEDLTGTSVPSQA